MCRAHKNKFCSIVKKGFERPGYYIDGKAPVQKYDWYGYYGREKNTNTSYEEKLKGDYKFEFSDYHDLVCIPRDSSISLLLTCNLFESRLAMKRDCVVKMLSCSI